MSAWWESLSPLQHVFAYFAFPATILLVLQTLLTLFGLGDEDASGSGLDAGADVDGAAGMADVDLDGLADMDLDEALDIGGDAGSGELSGGAGSGGDSLALFSLRGILSFFAVGGWAGIAAVRLFRSPVLAVLCAIVAGAAALLAVALLFKYTARLQSAGNLNLRNALGKSATVYVPIPAERRGAGKVHLILQERYSEVDAVTDEPAALPTGTVVDVVGLADENTLVVARKADAEAPH